MNENDIIVVKYSNEWILKKFGGMRKMKNATFASLDEATSKAKEEMSITGCRVFVMNEEYGVENVIVNPNSDISLI